MDFLQKLIHLLEQGSGLRYARITLSVLALVFLVTGYNFCAYRNMSTQEGMDAAQLARNLAQGKGYTTGMIRPFSMFLLTRHAQDARAVPGLGQAIGQVPFKSPHPDLANPPLYPVVLAAWMKLLPFDFLISDPPKPLWGIHLGPYWHQPDILIALLNQLLLCLVAGGTLILGRRLFGTKVGWLAAVLVLGTEQLWRFSLSGLPTLLLLLIFLGLVWSLVSLEEETREPRWGSAGLFVLAALAGVLVGLGGLTRYAFAWLILPVVCYVGLLAGRQRWVLGLTALLSFAAVFSPWVARNLVVSGTPFGTSGYALLEGSAAFPGHSLERTLEPNFTQLNVLTVFKDKLVANTGRLIQNDLPKLGGNWLVAFFLVGLLIPFGRHWVQRLRYFLLACLIVLAAAQALGRTALSDDSPEINSENLIVLVMPLVVIFGVAVIFHLLDQLNLAVRELRYLALAVFSGIVCLPLLLAMRVSIHAGDHPGIQPPYVPPYLQHTATFVKPDELLMSDMPWAASWYGRAPCVWFPQSILDFFPINDYARPVGALYLSPMITEKWKDMGDWNLLITQALQQPPLYSAKRPVALNLTVPQPGSAARATFPLSFWQLGSLDYVLLTLRPQPLKADRPAAEASAN